MVSIPLTWRRAVSKIAGPKIDSRGSAWLLAFAIMTAAEVFESVTNGGSKDFSALVRILNANQPWCLIGGLAVNCYVEPIYTIDADIVVMTDRLSQISKQLEQAEFQIQKFEHSIDAKGQQSQLRIQFTTDVRYRNSCRTRRSTKFWVNGYR